MNKPDAPDTPEIEKMIKLKEDLHTEAIGEFLEWLGSQGYWIARFEKWEDYQNEMLTITGKSIQDLLTDYAGIDLGKVDHEQRALLEWTRKVQGIDQAQK